MEQVGDSGEANGAAIGTTALARLHVLEPGGDGEEQVIRERRFGDAVTAREWLTQQVGQVDPHTKILEISVVTERWSSQRGWQRPGTRRRTETVQVGRRTGHGTMVWSDPLATSPKAGSRHAR